jgi:SAM-dependent methyltransferase
VVRASGEALPFEAEFDAVFSNAALHWMTSPQPVLEGVYRALRPSGRFVAEMGGHGNVAAIITAMRAVARLRGGDESLAGPWFFPTPESYGRMLEQAGFTVRRIELIPRPTKLKAGMAAWLKTFRDVFFQQFGADAPLVRAEVEDLLRPVLCDAQGQWTADYVRLRFEAVKDGA